jgi:2-phosphosulfolactate phosphatase
MAASARAETPARFPQKVMIIDAALNPAEIARLSSADLTETTCVVFDVLRATSSMITALAHGAAAIHPVCTIEEAFAAKERLPEAVLGGERHGDPIAGFDVGNSPFEYRGFRGRTIVSTTTNGTIALRACDGAREVLVAAILNLQAIAEHLRASAPARVLLVCAGTFDSFALEDAWAAGRLVDLLEGGESTDAAMAVLAVSRLYPHPLAALRAARNGRALAAKERDAEVAWCARESVFSAIGVMKAGVIRAMAGLSARENPATLLKDAG